MRFVAIIIGLFMLVSGAACGVAGGAVVAVFGTDGVFESGDESLRTDTRALVLKADDIGEQEPDEELLPP